MNQIKQYQFFFLFSLYTKCNELKSMTNLNTHFKKINDKTKLNQLLCMLMAILGKFMKGNELKRNET